MCDYAALKYLFKVILFRNLVLFSVTNSQSVLYLRKFFISFLTQVNAIEFMPSTKPTIIFSLNFYHDLTFSSIPDELRLNDLKLCSLSIAYYHFFY